MAAAPADAGEYRPCVGIILLNSAGRVFVGQRIDSPGDAWQMPQGGIDDGETPEAAARRELKEETGTANAEIIAESGGWLSYDLPEDLRPKLWGGRYRGQTQKWFVMRFLGRDAEIDIATPEAEFSAWKWVAPGDLPDLIVPFKRALYETLLKEFAAALR